LALGFAEVLGMTLLRASTFLALSTAMLACGPPPADDGNRSSNISGAPIDPNEPAPTAPDQTGARPLGSLEWNMALEGKGSMAGTIPVMNELLLRSDGSVAAWISSSVDALDQGDAQLFHGTYAFSKRPKTADDAPNHPVDSSYEDYVNGANDDGDAYLVVLTFSGGDAQTYEYYLGAGGGWFFRNVTNNVWMGLNAASHNGGSVTFCETAADCSMGACTPQESPFEPVVPSICQ
jgi:hypothetical protein